MICIFACFKKIWVQEEINFNKQSEESNKNNSSGLSVFSDGIVSA
jgi:hypothetical protein